MDLPVTTHALPGPCVPPLFDGGLRTCSNQPLDADVADDRLVLLWAQSQELGSTREAVVETAVQRLDLSKKQAGEAYTLAETFESNPRSVWGTCKGSRV